MIEDTDNVKNGMLYVDLGTYYDNLIKIFPNNILPERTAMVSPDLYKLIFDYFEKQNKETTAQVCDATEDEQN